MVAPLSVTPDSMQLGGVVPILRVADLQASIDYHVDVLGFALQWRHLHFIASVKQGRCELFLAAGDQGHAGSWVWIGVDDAEATCEHFRARGARIRHPPTNFPWALEMQLEDPDGNVLRIGSHPKDAPFGEWLDRNGRRWPADGPPG